MLKAWRAWKALTEEQRQIVRDKQVKLVRPVDELIALLKPIADMDKDLSGAGASVGCTLALAFVAGVIGLVVGTANNAPGWMVVVWCLLCAVAFFVPLIIYLSTRGIDVSDNLRLGALPMLYVLRDDIDPKEAVELHLDLRRPMCKEKFVREDKPRERMTEKFYNDPWMSAEAILIDGSRLRWSVVDTLRHRTRTKKSRSGKYKTKTKDSRKCTVDVELAVRNKSYAVSGGEAGEKRTTLTAKKTYKLAGVVATDPKYILEPITELFQQVSPVK